MLKLIARVSAFFKCAYQKLKALHYISIRYSGLIKYMIFFIPPQNLIISYLETVTIALAGPVAKPGWSQSPGLPTLVAHILEIHACISMPCHSITFYGRKF